MAASLPVVATRVGGNTEAVADGETGLLVPPSAPAELGAALLRLAHDQALRRAWGRAGRIRLETEFSSDACVAAYERLYTG